MMRILWIVLVVCVVKCSGMSRNELQEFSDFLQQTSQLDLNVKKGGGLDDDLFDEDEEISDHAWEDSGKFEGDLILNDRQRRLIVENVEGLSRNGLTDSTKRWPNNELIYFIQREHFNDDQLQAIDSGIADLAQASCVEFRPYKKGDRDAVVIQGSRRGCFAQVGYQGGYQVLNLSGRHPAGRGCFRHGTVVHELLHTLGFYHMQSSPDRDDYINVLWENILQPTRHNFRKYNSFSVSDFGVGYDYDSVLHYSRRAFSANGKDTLVPKQRGASIGQRVGLSDKDTQKLNKMYCDADNSNFEADETQKPKKKKKPKNQPFDGHGLGYDKGKTVVIKLPASESVKLPHISTIHPFDYFSTAPKTVSSPQAEVALYGEEVVYPYTPGLMTEYKTQSARERPDDDAIILMNMNMEPPQQSQDTAPIEERNKQIGHWESPRFKSVPQKNNVDLSEESLDEAYEKQSKNVKAHVYPKSRDYDFKINKDYSQFFQPSEYKGSDEIKKLDEMFGKSNPSPSPIEVPPHIQARKPIRITQTNRNERKESPISHDYEHTDTTYGTSLPFGKPYSAYEPLKYERPEYLKDRQNYSHSSSYLYSPRNNKEKHSLKVSSPLNNDDWYIKDPFMYTPLSYADYGMEHKSNEPRLVGDYDESTESPRKSQAYTSGEYYNDGSEMPKKQISQTYVTSGEYYDERASPRKSQAYTLYGASAPLADTWYKPSYPPEVDIASYEDS